MCPPSLPHAPPGSPWILVGAGVRTQQNHIPPSHGAEDVLKLLLGTEMLSTFLGPQVTAR